MLRDAVSWETTADVSQQTRDANKVFIIRFIDDKKEVSHNLWISSFTL